MVTGIKVEILFARDSKGREWFFFRRTHGQEQSLSLISRQGALWWMMMGGVPDFLRTEAVSMLASVKEAITLPKS